MRNENRNVRKTVPERMLYSLSIIFWSDYMPSGKLYSGSRKFGRVICIKYDFQSYCVIKNMHNLCVEFTFCTEETIYWLIVLACYTSQV